MSGRDDFNMEDNQPGSAKSAPSSSATPGAIPTKGTLFTNLGEAHQAITSRNASRSAGNGIPDTSTQPLVIEVVNDLSPTNSVGDHSSDQSVEDYTKTSRLPRQRCLTSRQMPDSPGDAVRKASTNPSLAASSLASLNDGSSFGGSHLGDGARDHSSRSKPLELRNLVKEDLGHHMPPDALLEHSRAVGRDLMVAAGANDQQCPYPNVPLGARQSNTVHNLNTERFNNNKGTTRGWRKIGYPASEPPHRPLPEIPRVDGGTAPCVSDSNKVLNLEFQGQSVSALDSQEVSEASPSGGQANLHEDSVENSTAPPDSLCVNTSHDEQNWDICDGTPSLAAHGDFARQTSRDRHISHGGISNGGLSNGTSDSDEDPFKYDCGVFSVFLNPSREREVSVALRSATEDSTASGIGLALSPPSKEPATPQGSQSTNPFLNKLNFYQAPTVNYSWDDEDEQEAVKISVRARDSLGTPAEGDLGLCGFAQRLGNERRRKDIHTLMSDGADWETVATSIAQFDSNRAFSSSLGLSGSHPVKITGSSIADYSDTSSVYAPCLEPFSSTDRILQPPPATYAPNAPCLRTLEGSGRPVFLPEPRIHRVNKYLQNSRRIFTDPAASSSGTSVRSAFVEKFGASIRSRSAAKRVQPQDLQLNTEGLSHSRFQSRDSINSTDSENDGATAEAQMDSRRPANTDGQLISSPLEFGDPPISHQRGQSVGPESPTLFSFPLISLEEAAKREALKRANNFTVTSGVRTRKNSSMDSSNATQNTNPSAPHITKPPPTAQPPRRPTLSSTLEESIVIGYNRGASRASTYRSDAPLVTDRSTAMTRISNNYNPSGTMGNTSQTSNNNGNNNNNRDWVRAGYRNGAPTFIFSSPPRLIPRDQRDAARRAHLNNMEAANRQLRQIAALDTGHADPLFPVPTDDAHLSWEARTRRQAYYYFLCVLAIVPFFGPFIYMRTFDSALSWYTHGETASLSRKQRRNVLFLVAIWAALWLAGIAVVVALAVENAVERKGKGH